MDAYEIGEYAYDLYMQWPTCRHTVDNAVYKI